MQTIAGTGAHRFDFCVPDDFVSLVSIELIVAYAVGAVGSGKDIDLYSDYGAVGQSTVQHSESDTTSTYTLSGPDTWQAFDISGVFNSLSAGDHCGLLLDHKSIGGSAFYLGVKMVYLTS